MKYNIHHIVLIAVMAALASCERYIDLSETGPENLLIANANLVAGDTLHSVYLGLSRFNETRPVSSAHLVCFVNGNKVAEADDLISHSFSYYVRELQFKADFSAGDEVKLSIDADGCHVESVSIVPETPVIASVDTSTVRRKADDGEVRDFSLYEVELQDVKGMENFYRFRMSLHSTGKVGWVHPGLEDEYHVGDTIDVVTKDIDIDNSMEPLLRKNINLGGGDSDDSWNYYNNRYNIFTDNSFADGSHVFNLITAANRDLNSFRYGFVLSEMRPLEEREMEISVLSMSRPSYIYMNDYMFDQSDQGSWTIVGEIPYPSNVSGGTGMISVMNRTSFMFRLPALQMDENGRWVPAK